jgi:hypothetical protein
VTFPLVSVSIRVEQVVTLPNVNVRAAQTANVRGELMADG